MVSNKVFFRMIFGNKRWMFFIEFFQRKNGSVEFRDVVEYIVEREGNIDRKYRKSVYVSFMQMYLLKFEREGIVIFSRGRIIFFKVFDNVIFYMEVVQKNDISWSVFYVGFLVIFVFMVLWFGNVFFFFVVVIYLVVFVIQYRRMYFIVRLRE